MRRLAVALALLVGPCCEGGGPADLDLDATPQQRTEEALAWLRERLDQPGPKVK